MLQDEDEDPQRGAAAGEQQGGAGGGAGGVAGGAVHVELIDLVSDSDSDATYFEGEDTRLKHTPSPGPSQDSRAGNLWGAGPAAERGEEGLVQSRETNIDTPAAVKAEGQEEEEVSDEYFCEHAQRWEFLSDVEESPASQ